jgi:hypothetical protein
LVCGQGGHGVPVSVPPSGVICLTKDAVSEGVLQDWASVAASVGSAHGHLAPWSQPPAYPR